ncbi:helix-turn-helix domain-containing protein [Murimonas intestini]|nr:helix-turn-helix domain-containing protein [Murimonas intestini]
MTILSEETGSRRSVYSYQYLRNNNQMGYHTEDRNGSLYHCLNQDIMVSILQYQREKNVKISMFLNDIPFNHEISDLEMPRHRNDFIELTYVIQGTISVIVDQELMTFTENELYLINPNVPFQEKKNISDAVVFNISLRSSFFNEILLSNIPEDSLQGFLRKCLMNEKNSAKMLRFTPSIHSVQKKISDVYSLILTEYKTRATGYMLIIQGYFTRLLDYLVSNYQFSFSEDVKNKYKEYMFQEVKNYLYTHYQVVQLQDLEDTFHYSGNYFNRLIQTFTGKSYSSYLIHIRLKIARDMLEYSTKKIDDIMEQVGYHNKGFFYKVFTEKYGKTPAAYRRELKKQDGR